MEKFEQENSNNISVFHEEMRALQKEEEDAGRAHFADIDIDKLDEGTMNLWYKFKEGVLVVKELNEYKIDAKRRGDENALEFAALVSNKMTPGMIKDDL